MTRKILCLGILACCLVLFGCPPPAQESIDILSPVDLQAHDISLATELASIDILIDLTSSSGIPPEPGTFQAFVTEDIPGAGPTDVDSQGNPIEQPIDITSHFDVDYSLETAVLAVPLDLPMGWYFLEAKVRDNQNVEASDLVVFSVDYPGPLFLGSSNSPVDSIPAHLTGAYDECFGGAMNDIWWDAGSLGLNNIPTFLEVQAAPQGLPVEVQVPKIIVPSGVLTFEALLVNNAMLFAPTPIPPVDLSPWTSGLVPCEIRFDLSGVFRRTGTESAAPRLVLQNVTMADSPRGGTCWLPPPPADCQMVADMEAEAHHYE